MSTEGQKVILVAVDDSAESTYSLEWVLDHVFTPNSGFKIVLITVKPLPTSVLKLSGPWVTDVLPIVETDLKKAALDVVESAKEICASRNVPDFEAEVVEGDARHALCDAVEKHHADMLVMGSHGYGALKRAILGSVSDYCAHHAHCSVLIVKKPKAKADH